MENNVHIIISGLQKEVSDEPTIVECDGCLTTRAKKHYLRYTDENNMRNTIIINADSAKSSVSVTKFYPLSENAASTASTLRSDESTDHTIFSKLDYITGEVTNTLYPTAYGNFETEIKTFDIRVSTELSDLTCLIIYSLKMNNQHISKCELTIRARYL